MFIPVLKQCKREKAKPQTPASLFNYSVFNYSVTNEENVKKQT